MLLYPDDGSVTFSNNQPLRYVEAPEFIEPIADPIIMNTPRYQAPVKNSTYKYPWKYTENERPCGKYGRCYDCGMEYGTFPDMVISNELWALITPSQHKEGGLLCPTCIANRLDFIGKWYDLRLLNSKFGINPDYLKLAKIAFDTVLRTLIEGEKVHVADEWKDIPIAEHGEHAYDHIRNFVNGRAFKGLETGEDNIAHALTRCAMIKMLEDEHAI